MGAPVAIIAAKRARLQREFANHLREQKSFSRETAALLRPQRWLGRRALLAMVANGSIVSAGEDLYWLDEAAYAVARERRRSRIVWILLAVLVFLVGTIALGSSLGLGG